MSIGQGSYELLPPVPAKLDPLLWIWTCNITYIST